MAKKQTITINLSIEAKEMLQAVANKLYPEYGNKMSSAVIERLLLTVGPDLLAIENYDPMRMALDQVRGSRSISSRVGDYQITQGYQESQDYYEEDEIPSSSLQRLLN